MVAEFYSHGERRTRHHASSSRRGISDFIRGSRRILRAKDAADAGANHRNQKHTMNPKHILIIVAILLAALSYMWPQTLAAAVIILAAANFVP